MPACGFYFSSTSVTSLGCLIEDDALSGGRFAAPQRLDLAGSLLPVGQPHYVHGLWLQC